MSATSAIGEYVHYIASNYDTYGIKRRKKGNEGNNAGQVFGAVKARVSKQSKKSKSDINKTKVARFISNLISNTSKYQNGNFNKSADEAKWAEFLYNQLYQEFGPALGRVLNNGDIRWGLKKPKQPDKGLVLSKLHTVGTVRLKPETILNRIKSIETQLEVIKKEFNLKDSDIWYNHIIELMNKMQSYWNQYKGMVDGQGYFSVTSLGDETENFNSFILSTNDILKKVSLSRSLKQQKGALVEYAIGIAVGQMENIALKKLKEQFMSIIVGNERSRPEMDMSRIDQVIRETDMKTLNIDYEEDLGGYFETLSLRPTQGKVDITFQLKDKNVLNVQAKNYNLNFWNNIGVLNGTNLLYLMMENTNNAVNHWLNILAFHPGKRNNISKYREQGIQALKLSIAFSALAGTKKDTNKVNMFIVNNNQTGQVSILNLSEMMDKISSNLNLVNIKPDLSNLTLPNTHVSRRGGGAKHRIANLLLRARQTSISASVSKSIL